jgi:peptide methionine sulfoxide reductase msrA/msrB
MNMAIHKTAFLAVVVYLLAHSGYADEMKRKLLTPEEERVIVHKGTEAPFTGKYYNFHGKGTYVCKRCGALLYRSEDKFDSGCGWPSFDDEIPGAVKRQPDADGIRTEILCARCGAHLGHVFTGEGLTPKNTRYCVNSISMDFIPAGGQAADTAAVPGAGEQQAEAQKAEAQNAEAPKMAATATPAKAIFAGGCFWGVQYYLERASGVISTRVGYVGGHKDDPTYKEVCRGDTGHFEAVEVTYDPAKTNYETIAKLFFEIHDPTQVDGQGPDIGKQYHSAVLYLNEEQKATAEKLVRILKNKGYRVAAQVLPAGTFWPAEDYHQRYYDKNGHTPYCHAYKKRF